MEITFELIEPLIKDTAVNGNNLTCFFKAPDSDQVVEAVVNVNGFQGSSSRTISQIKSEARNVISYYLRQLLQRFFGYSLSSSISRVADEALRRPSGTVTLSKGDRKKAIVKAFESVFSQFEYTDSGWKKKISA